jgi:hypothetical protein
MKLVYLLANIASPTWADAQVVGDAVPAPGESIAATLVKFLLVPVLALVGWALFQFSTKTAADRERAKAEGKNTALGTAIAIGTKFLANAFEKVRAGIADDLAKALADGKITAEERAHLLSKLLALAKNELPAQVMAALAGAFGGGLDTWLHGEAAKVVDQAVANAQTAKAALSP